MDKKLTKAELLDDLKGLPTKTKNSIRVLIKGDITTTFKHAMADAAAQDIILAGNITSGTVSGMRVAGKYLIYGEYIVVGRIVHIEILERPPFTMGKIIKKVNTFFSKKYDKEEE